MAWYWYVAIALQILADIFFLIFILLLVLAQSHLTNKIKVLAETMLQTAFMTDTRFNWTNKNVKNMAQFLVGVFGLEAPPVKDEPPASPADPSKLKN
jgi:hypothetical protein